MISATPNPRCCASLPSPLNVEDRHSITEVERRPAARIFRVFPSRPHAYTGKRHLYTEKHTGDYPLGTERTFGREDGAVTDVDLDRMGPDPASAPSLHVEATILAFRLDHTSFFDEVAQTLALAVVQCMPSHPKHDKYVARTKQLRERIAGAQKAELSRWPLPVVNVESPEPFIVPCCSKCRVGRLG